MPNETNSYLIMDSLEVQQIAQQTMNGNWIPFSIVIFLIGIILVMIIKNNDKKHLETNEMLKELAKNNNYLSKMVAVHDSEIENLKK